MKKVLLALTALFCVVFANAQVKPVAGDWGLGLNVPTVGFNSYYSSPFGQGGAGSLVGFGDYYSGINGSRMIFGRYYVNDNIAARLGFSLFMGGSTSSSSDSVFSFLAAGDKGVLTSETTTKNGFGLNFVPGIEYHLMTEANKIDPYVGGEIWLSFVGSSSMDSTASFSGTLAGTAGSSSYSGDMSMAGGSMFGVNAILGFNWFPFNNFNMGIGAEYKWGFGSSSAGGDYDGSFTSTTNAYGTTVTSSGSTTGSSKSGSNGLGVGSTLGVNLFFFW